MKQNYKTSKSLLYIFAFSWLLFSLDSRCLDFLWDTRDAHEFFLSACGFPQLFCILEIAYLLDNVLGSILCVRVMSEGSLQESQQIFGPGDFISHPLKFLSPKPTCPKFALDLSLQKSGFSYINFQLQENIFFPILTFQLSPKDFSWLSHTQTKPNHSLKYPDCQLLAFQANDY